MKKLTQLFSKLTSLFSKKKKDEIKNRLLKSEHIGCFVIHVINNTKHEKEFELFGLRNIKHINSEGHFEKDGLIIKNGHINSTYEDLLYYTIGKKIVFDQAYILTENKLVFDEDYVYKDFTPFGLLYEKKIKSFIDPFQYQSHIAKLVDAQCSKLDLFIYETSSLRGKMLPNTSVQFQFYAKSIETNIKTR